MIRDILAKAFPCLRPKDDVELSLLPEVILEEKPEMVIELAWGQRVDNDFQQRVIGVCAWLGWDPRVAASYLMACMAFETGRTFSPSIKNMAGSGATGLIQFMPKTAVGLGTTTDKLSQMTAVEQMRYVERHFEPYANRVETLCDMYMAIFLPKYIGRNDDTVLFERGQIGYTQNAGLDRDKKGYITKGDCCFKVLQQYSAGLEKQNVAYVTIPETSFRDLLPKA
jgi:hypothetical protein